jgi:F0F1-type ATP synthase assembly protein I
VFSFISTFQANGTVSADYRKGGSVPQVQTVDSGSRILSMLGLQLLCLALLFLGLWMKDVEAAKCALLGGGIGIVIQLYFASKILMAHAGQAPIDLVRTAYVGEIIKFALIIVSFTLSLVFVEALQESKNFFWFFLAFMISMAVSWLTPVGDEVKASN